jgi:hypothetical protein
MHLRALLNENLALEFDNHRSDLWFRYLFLQLHWEAFNVLMLHWIHLQPALATDGHTVTAGLQRLFSRSDPSTVPVRLDTLQWNRPLLCSLRSRGQRVRPVTPAIPSTLLAHELPLP